MKKGTSQHTLKLTAGPIIIDFNDNTQARAATPTRKRVINRNTT